MFICSLTALCKPRMLEDGCLGFVGGTSRGMVFFLSRNVSYARIQPNIVFLQVLARSLTRRRARLMDAGFRRRSVTVLFSSSVPLLKFKITIIHLLAGRMAVAGSRLCRRGCGSAKVGRVFTNGVLFRGLWRMAGIRGRRAAPSMVRFLLY